MTTISVPSLAKGTEIFAYTRYLFIFIIIILVSVRFYFLILFIVSRSYSQLDFFRCSHDYRCGCRHQRRCM